MTDEVTVPGHPRLPLNVQPRAKFIARASEAVELEKIDLGENVRKEIERGAVETLAATIKDVGLIQPVTLIRLSSGRYKLHVGFRRFTAFQLLAATDDHFKRIPAIVLEREPETRDAGLQQLIENVARVDLSPLDVAGGIAAYVEEDEDGEPVSKAERAARIERIAATFNWSARTVKKHLQLWHAPGWFRELGRAVKAERKKLDDAGNAIIDPKTNKPVVEVKRWPALQTTFLEKLLAFLNDAEQADSAAMNKDGSARPRARSIVERVAVSCAEQQWSVQRLDREIEVARAGLHGVERQASSKTGKSPYEASETRLVLDLKIKDSLTVRDREIIAAQATALLTALGYRSVVIDL